MERRNAPQRANKNSSKTNNRRSNKQTNNQSDSNKPKGNKTLKEKLWRVWCVIFSIIFVGTILVGVVGIYIFADAMKNIPELDLEKIMTPQNTVVYDRHGNEVADLSEDSLIMIDSYDQVPQSLVDAFNATEDARFFVHKGIDGPRTLKGLIGTYVFNNVSGGSTITQQLVKQVLLADKIAGGEYTSTEQRKIDEWVLSFRLEKELTKEEILLSYLNNAINYGRFTGVGTAARRYFNKSISELTMPEAALLAGIPQLPAENNPFYQIDTATERYHEVLSLMHLHNYITEEEMKLAQNIPLADLVVRNQDAFTNQNAAYFTAVEAELAEIFKDYDNTEGLPVYYKNYRVYTELDQEMQAFANRIMETNEFVDWTDAEYYAYGSDYTYEEGMNFQGAFTVVDVHTGGIPAVGASRNIRESGYNIAVEGYRSPGSSIKPIIDYTPAVEKYDWGSNHLMNDKLTYYSGTSSQVYNYNQTGHKGIVTMEAAIGDSLNTTAVQALQAVGLEEAARIAGSMGITKAVPLLNQGMLGESAALGGGLETTTKEMAAAHATLGNGGIYYMPHTVTRVENIETGEVVWEYNPATQGQRVIKESTAATMVKALIYGRNHGTLTSGRKQVSGGITFGGKTGTSSYSAEEMSAYGVSYYAEKDHWHAGTTPEYAIAAWTGLAVEGEAVLLRTGGNSNNNKAVGSYIMATFLNEFAPYGTDFSFLGSANREQRGSIGDFSIHVDNTGKSISWTVPGVNLPSGMTESDKKSVTIVYDVTVTTSSGESYSATTEGTTINYPSGNFDSGSVTVTARANSSGAASVIEPRQVSNNDLKNPAPKPAPTPSPKPSPNDDFESMTVVELKKIANELGIKYNEDVKKEELIEAIRKQLGNSGN